MLAWPQIAEDRRTRVWGWNLPSMHWYYILLGSHSALCQAYMYSFKMPQLTSSIQLRFNRRFTHSSSIPSGRQSRCCFQWPHHGAAVPLVHVSASCPFFSSLASVRSARDFSRSCGLKCGVYIFCYPQSCVRCHLLLNHAAKKWLPLQFSFQPQWKRPVCLGQRERPVGR